MSERAVIIGAGQAGAQGAQSMRQAGFDGEIILVGAESELPYQRPPLSKAYLKGEMAKERLYLRPSEFYEQNAISLRLQKKVVSLERENKTIVLDDDERLSYDKALIATGAPPRRLNAPGADLKNIFYLRTLADADAMRSLLSTDGRVVIVGAGYIGLEVAAVARSAGRDVTVLEIADCVLARVACAPLSHAFETLHRKHGVDLRLSSGLTAFQGENGALKSVTLNTGETIDCGAVLVGIGAEPAVELAADAGLQIGDGIIVDEHAQTSDPSIWAAGDCTNFPSSRYGRRMRLESVPNAIEQAKVAGANMAGASKVHDAIPWFWSDQYDVKLQTIGLSEGADETVLRGKPDAQPFSIWHLRDGQVLAVEALNDPAAFAVARKLMMKNAKVDPVVIEDPTSDLKALAAAS